jgi:hypothetical protein
MSRSYALFLLLGTFTLASSAQSAPLILASDDMPEGDDEMPEGDDPAQDEEDPPAKRTTKPLERAQKVETMPDGEEDEIPPESSSPSLVTIAPAAPCSIPPRSEGYLQAHLERARSIDLHGVDAEVRVVEGRGSCIAQVEVAIAVEAGCDLTMRFEQESGGVFSLASLRFNASNCSELAGLKRGRYLLHQGDAELTLSGEEDGTCMPRGELRIQGSLVVKNTHSEFAIDLDGMRVRGDFQMHVDETIACRKRRHSAPVTLSSDRPALSRGPIWPWVAGSAGVLAVGGATTWYLMTRSPATGALTLQIQ